jgi:hypothetical protein
VQSVTFLKEIDNDILFLIQIKPAKQRHAFSPFEKRGRTSGLFFCL